MDHGQSFLVALGLKLSAMGFGPIVRHRSLGATRTHRWLAVRATQGDFIARVGPARAHQALLCELRMVSHLLERGLFVPPVLGTTSLSFLGRTDQQPWASGKHRSTAALPVAHAGLYEMMIFFAPVGREVAEFELKPAHAASIGRFYGALHQATARMSAGYRPALSWAGLRQLSERALMFGPTDERRLDMLVLKRALKNARWPRLAGRVVLCGSLSTASVRFSCSRLTGVMGLSELSVGPALWDLACGLADWAYQRDILHPPRARALIAAYGQRRPGKTAVYLPELYQTLKLLFVARATRTYARFEVQDMPLGPREQMDACLGTTRFEDYRHHVARLEQVKKLGEARFVTLLKARAPRAKRGLLAQTQYGQNHGKNPTDGRQVALGASER